MFSVKKHDAGHTYQPAADWYKWTLASRQLQREKHLPANPVLGAAMQPVNPISRGQTRAVLLSKYREGWKKAMEGESKTKTKKHIILGENEDIPYPSL